MPRKQLGIVALVAVSLASIPTDAFLFPRPSQTKSFSSLAPSSKEPQLFGSSGLHRPNIPGKLYSDAGIGGMVLDEAVELGLKKKVVERTPLQSFIHWSPAYVAAAALLFVFFKFINGMISPLYTPVFSFIGKIPKRVLDSPRAFRQAREDIARDGFVDWFCDWWLSVRSVNSFGRMKVGATNLLVCQTDEDIANLKTIGCANCGRTMYISKGRAMWQMNVNIGSECRTCGAPTKEAYYDLNDPTDPRNYRDGEEVPPEVLELWRQEEIADLIAEGIDPDEYYAEIEAKKAGKAKTAPAAPASAPVPPPMPLPPVETQLGDLKETDKEALKELLQDKAFEDELAREGKAVPEELKTTLGLDAAAASEEEQSTVPSPWGSSNELYAAPSAAAAAGAADNSAAEEEEDPVAADSGISDAEEEPAAAPPAQEVVLGQEAAAPPPLVPEQEQEDIDVLDF
mmetsp:Transcript_17765/g.26812  ORF Transcript_17765/g.26812 Transcript_17765/m.26812 type:complete len:456 (+) Transcript_17765:54-1421(+)